MSFKTWLEQHWWEFKETITLYHGTSSAFLDKIKQEGIIPPGEKLEDYAARIAKQSFPGDVPEEYWEKIMNSVYNIRADTDKHKLTNVIYLTPDYEGAAGYAKAYYELGGEIAYDVFKWAVIYCNEYVLPQPRKPLQGSQPIVVEVNIPYGWIRTYGDLQTKKKHFDRWYDPKDDYETYMKGQTDFEVRVEQPIPVSMIKNITTVS